MVLVLVRLAGRHALLSRFAKSEPGVYKGMMATLGLRYGTGTLGALAVLYSRRFITKGTVL